jgi:hypothetical protein
MAWGKTMNALERPFPEAQWEALRQDGYLLLKGAFRAELETLEDAVTGVQRQFPFGFKDPWYYTGKQPVPRTTPREYGRILIPYIGFMDTRILGLLANPALHELLERIVGKDFYLSNSWYQVVPPGMPRLGYHKDSRGSVTLNVLLDDIAPGMGSTCLVPGSHINTPPAAFCMSNLRARHPREVDIVGAAGDGALFTTETWHARSLNESQHTTRRLFYNFYSRSSKPTTAWGGVISDEQLEAARASLPREYAHMFRIDAAQTKSLSRVGGSALRRWAFGRSSEGALIRDFFFAFYAYRQSVESEASAGFLLPFTTRLSAARKFSLIEYLGKLKLIPTMRNTYSFLRQFLNETILRKPRVAKVYD